MHDFLGLDDSCLQEDHRLLRSQVQRFVAAEIAPHADDWERDGRVPDAAFLRLGAAGLLGLAFPAAYGGLGMDTLASTVFNEELARSGYGGLTASITVVSDMTALHLVRAGSEAQRQRYLPGVVAGRTICALGVTEPRGGSDLTRMATTARKDADGYVLNGHKLYITNATIAGLYFVVAKTDLAGSGAGAYSLFVVERNTPGLRIGRRLAKTGWHSSDTGEIFFDDARIPADALIGEEGRGFYYMMWGLDHERLCAAAQACGLADAAFDHTLAWLRHREAYGRTLWDLQVVRQEIAKLFTEFTAARSMLYLAAAKASRGERIAMEAAMLKGYLPELVNRILYKCVQFNGGAGYMSETPVERNARDARILSIGGGASEVMFDEVAKRLA